MEPTHRKTKTNQNLPITPKQHNEGIVPKVNQPYTSFLSSLNNSQQTANEDKTEENRSTITTYLLTNESTTQHPVEPLKFF